MELLKNIEEKRPMYSNLTVNSNIFNEKLEKTLTFSKIPTE